MTGEVGDALTYAYHDAHDRLKLTIETVEVNPEGDLTVFAPKG